MSRNCLLICLPTKYLQKKRSQVTIIKFIKALIKFISENYTNKISYVRLVVDEPNEIQHPKSLSNWTTQQKN